MKITGTIPEFEFILRCFPHYRKGKFMYDRVEITVKREHAPKVDKIF